MNYQTPALTALARRIQLALVAKNRPEVVCGVLAHWIHRAESTTDGLVAGPSEKHHSGSKL